MKKFVSFLFAAMLVASVISCKEAAKDQEGNETAEASQVEEVKIPAPSETVLTVMNAFKDGKFSETIEKYSFMTDEDKKEFEAEREEFDIMMSEAMAITGGIVSCEILEEKVDGDKAVVKYETKYGNGEKETQEDELVLIDGNWFLK